MFENTSMIQDIVFKSNRIKVMQETVPFNVWLWLSTNNTFECNFCADCGQSALQRFIKGRRNSCKQPDVIQFQNSKTLHLLFLHLMTGVW